jgi:hypothetical protein
MALKCIVPLLPCILMQSGADYVGLIDIILEELETKILDVVTTGSISA